MTSHPAFHRLALALLVCSGAAARAEQTGAVGSGAPFDNRQPSIALNMAIGEYGIYGIGVPVRMFAFDLPDGWAKADGRLLPVSQFSTLATELGSTYGGDGTNTFGLPDLRGRSPLGMGAGPGTSSYALAQTAGTDQATLSVAAMPVHAHPVQCNAWTGTAGSGEGFDNRQPSLALAPEIAYSGVFPPRNRPAAERGLAASPALPFYGQIFFHSKPAVNGDFFPAAGQILQWNQYSALFSILGTTFGGNGSFTFGLPDLRGRLATFFGTGPGLSSYDWGTVAGAENPSLFALQLPPHSHTVPGAPDTGPAGNGFAFDNRQPTLAIRYLMCTQGVYPSGFGPDDQSTYIGEIIMFAGNFDPVNFAGCDGRLLPKSGNEALFSLLGTRYGGDGVISFGLPDLRGRVPIGTSDALPLGTLFGSEQVQLSVDNLPSHTHTLPPACPGDLNGDGQRNTFDLGFLLSHFGESLPPGTCSDINGDGIVNTFDLGVFLSKFGVPCP